MKYFTVAFSLLDETDSLTVTIALDKPGGETGCHHKKRYLDINNCADLTGLSRSKLYFLVAHKQIPFLRHGRRIFFIKHQLREWLKKNSYKKTA